MDKKASIGQRIKEVLPGLIVCIAIATVSKMIGKYLPSLGAATISIFLGIIIGNVIGWQGILFILIQMVLTIAFIVVVGKKMHFNIDFVLLMASGNSVCGSSAIASCAPVIHANSKDKGIALIIIWG